MADSLRPHSLYQPRTLAKSRRSSGPPARKVRRSRAFSPPSLASPPAIMRVKLSLLDQSKLIRMLKVLRKDRLTAPVSPSSSSRIPFKQWSGRARGLQSWQSEPPQSTPSSPKSHTPLRQCSSSNFSFFGAFPRMKSDAGYLHARAGRPFIRRIVLEPSIPKFSPVTRQHWSFCQIN